VYIIFFGNEGRVTTRLEIATKVASVNGFKRALNLEFWNPGF
jgi:hypothetical protein